MSTPADWYPDPEGAPGDLRYWDGTQWTEHRAPADRAAAPPPAPAPVPAPAPAPVPATPSMPADWYQDPEGAPGDLRYWDGTQWTDHRAPADRGAPTAPTVAAPPPPASAPPPPAAAPTPPPEPVVAAPPPPPASPEPSPAAPPPPEPPITPGVAAGMTLGAAATTATAPAAAAAPPMAAPPAPPVGPTSAPPPTPPTGPARKSRAPLFIVLAILVVILVIGGVVGAVVIGGGSSKKSPSQWASSFCRNKAVTAAAQKVDTTKNAVVGEDLDKIADYLDSLAEFLTTSADAIKSVGTPDVTGGGAMVNEVPSAFRDGASKVRSIAEDVRDGSMRTLQQFSADSWDPLASMSTQAQDAWKQVQDQVDTSNDCAGISKALNSE